MKLDEPVWRNLRKELSKLLSTKNKSYKRLEKYLLPMKEAELQLPVAVGDYSDFYTGIHHATNVGKLLRPDNPLLPNYKWVPIGYHGRASTIVVSGTPVVRPSGQISSAISRRRSPRSKTAASARWWRSLWARSGRASSRIRRSTGSPGTAITYLTSTTSRAS